MTNYDLTLQNFQAHLTAGGYHTVARTLPPTPDQGFLCELLTDGIPSFLLKIRPDQTLGFALLEAYPGLTIPPDRWALAAQYITSRNAETKVGTLCLCPHHGDLSCRVEASFLSAPLTGQDLAAMERIAVSLLLACQEDLARICRGLPPQGP